MEILIFQGLRGIKSTPWPDMLAIPVVMEKLREAQEILDQEGINVEGQRLDLVSYCEREVPFLSQHTLTVFEHPVIYAVSIALWEAQKPDCDAVIGFSCGEFTAAVAAGCLDFKQGLLTAVERGKGIGSAGGASLLLLTRDRLPIKRMRALCKLTGGVWLGNINSFQQGIISGDPVQIVKIQRRLAKRFPNLRVSPIDLGGAVHTPLMTPARRRLNRFLENLKFTKPRIPVICNASGLPEQDPQRIKQLLLRQMNSRLNFTRTVKNLPEDVRIHEICLPQGRDTVTKLIESEFRRAVLAQRKMRTVSSFGS